MFYKPLKVTDWDTQNEKWWATWLIQWTPIPLMVLWSNFWNYIYDGLTIVDQKMLGTFPSMYNNWFAQLMLEDTNAIWGVFIWYDMFTWSGFFNWYLNLLMLDWALIVEVIFGVLRAVTEDWTYLTVETLNNVDMNRIFEGEEQVISSHDKDYWTSRSNGKDCNG